MAHLEIEGDTAVIKPVCQAACVSRGVPKARQGNIRQPALSQGAQTRQQIIWAGACILHRKEVVSVANVQAAVELKNCATL